MAKRIIGGTVLTLTLILSSHQAQALRPQSPSRLSEANAVADLVAGYLETDAKEKSFGSANSLKNLTLIKPDSQGDGRLLVGGLSLPKLAVLQPRFTSQLNNLSPLATRLYNRSEPGNLRDQVLRQACGYLGAPYRRGGSLQRGHATDCSGFVQYIYQKSNIDLPRSSPEQAQAGRLVARTMDFSRLMAGDLLFFRRGGRHIGHVGIYMGEGKMIHASSQRRGVTITDLRQSYYQDTFVVAKRLAEPQPSQQGASGGSRLPN
ncbi:MAG: C40 family peptidase [Deltaproteobacteria bacterium]|nr:C40 family peptidase [Deltaproteobacteria bacterium]